VVHRREAAKMQRRHSKEYDEDGDAEGYDPTGNCGAA
jgi:hypothetical protein